MRPLFVAAVLWASPASAVPELPPDFGEAASFDIVGGGSTRGGIAAAVTGGYPWSSVRVQVGLPGGVTPIIAVDTALFRRWEPTAGVGGRFVDTPRGRFSGEVLLGWTIDAGEVPANGPRVVGRLRVMGKAGRVAPWGAIATAHTLFFDDVVTQTAGGDFTERSVRHQWAPVIEVGVAVAIGRNIGFELGFDWHLVGAPDAFALPGLHIGVQFGGEPGAAR